MSSKEKIESNKKAKKRHDCAKLMDLDELGQSLSDVEKVIKPEYASPEISGKENEEDVFYIVQIPWRNQSLCELIQKLDQENEKKERSSSAKKNTKDYERFDDLKNHLPVAPNSDDVNDGILPAWALSDNHDAADHDFESDN
ncbi:hypothetical protein C2G38_2242692 [Gigaspora rosea]|uniref:Uncharacterized protein n=1 Tax=Gigaspora rosea TaxID=44941 RepID=A0A397VLS7_9GLOM|nr:hypothetical protein C2G38_2242692 [Gigaspora rosea]